MATSVSVAQAPAPILTPQVAAHFVRDYQKASTGSSGTQEKREPKVDAALQLKTSRPCSGQSSSGLRHLNGQGFHSCNSCAVPDTAG